MQWGQHRQATSNKIDVPYCIPHLKKISKWAKSDEEATLEYCLSSDANISGVRHRRIVRRMIGRRQQTVKSQYLPDASNQVKAFQ